MGDITSACGWANWAIFGGFTYGQCKQPPQDPSGSLHAGSCCVHSGISWSGVDCQDDCPYGYTNEMGDITSGCGWLNSLTWLGATVMGRCTERPPLEAMNDAYLTSKLMEIALAKSANDRNEWNEHKKVLRERGYIIQSSSIDDESFHLIEAEEKTTFGEDGAHIVYFFGEHGGNNELVIGFPGSGSWHDFLVTDGFLALNGGLDTKSFSANGETFRAQRSVLEHYESTRDEFLRQMDEILKKTCIRSCVDVIRIVGHSLGGTAAQFGAVDMAKRYGDKYDIWLSTYASPRAFDSSSSDRVHSLLTRNGNMANRFMLYGDIIPWAGTTLKHVGDAYLIEKGYLYEKGRNYMPVDTKAILCCPTCITSDNVLTASLNIAVAQECVRRNHFMGIYAKNVNLIKNNNRKYLEDLERVPAREVTRKCSAFLPTCSDVDVRVYKENWACEVVRHVPGPSTPEACAQAVLAESTCSKDHFTWSDSSLVGVPCKCVRDCGSTGVSSNVYDTYSMIPRGTARRSLRRILKKSMQHSPKLTSTDFKNDLLE